MTTTICLKLLNFNGGTNHFTSRKLSHVSAPESPSSSSSSKRGSNFINLVSSEEDNDDEVTPKKPRRAITKRSDSLELKSELPVYSDTQSRSSSSSFVSPRLQPQRFHRVEIPVRRLVSIAPTTPIALAQRDRFLQNLSKLRGPKVTVFNDIDESSPSIRFRFVNESVLCHGVAKASEEFMIGCECKEHYGPLPGCAYLEKCHCLDESPRNENGSKVFPYSAASRDAGCLRSFYLESRHHIYECNRACNCTAACKNRNVQHGRRVQLDIFKTSNRGWGLRCPVDLRKGEFIDTYRGEIITHEEANQRGINRSVDEGNYLLNFDKFSEPEAIPKSDFLATFPDKLTWHANKVREGDWKIYQQNGEDMWLNPEYVPYLYVCDGMYVGGPTRFMNHSCDPNCRLFTVSYNHADQNLYELAFFTTQAIPAGTELTFDYKDEDDRSVITQAQALELHQRDGYMPQKCLCGTPECRQYFFN
ncbi:MAG: hypothetical protein Q9170_007266 [Blastenia crenularia]